MVFARASKKPSDRLSFLLKQTACFPILRIVEDIAPEITLVCEVGRYRWMYERTKGRKVGGFHLRSTRRSPTTHQPTCTQHRRLRAAHPRLTDVGAHDFPHPDATERTSGRPILPAQPTSNLITKQNRAIPTPSAILPATSSPSRTPYPPPLRPLKTPHHTSPTWYVPLLPSNPPEPH